MRLFTKVFNGVPTHWDLTFVDVRSLAPSNISLPEAPEQFDEVDISDIGFETYHLTQCPEYNPTFQIPTVVAPILIEGVWTQQWSIVALPEEVVAVNVAAAKETAWERIKARRDTVKGAGVLVGTKWFHSDADSRIQQLGLVIMGANVPSVQWKTMDGSFVTMTQALAGQIFAATAARDMAAFTAAETHHSYMLASMDPDNYDDSTGWPASFGE